MAHGYLPYAKAWYRKAFFLEPSSTNKSAWLDFDGVATRSEVWLNGVLLGKHDSAYTPFRHILNRSSPARWGSRNVLAIRVDAYAADSWWYDGGGIYRHVWLTVAEPVHISPWGVYALASVVGRLDAPAKTAAADVRPSISVANEGAVDVQIEVQCTVYDAYGIEVAESRATVVAGRGRTTTVLPPPMRLASALLWSPRQPALYRLGVDVRTVQAGVALEAPCDSLSTTFGVRHLRWDAATGFYINGAATKILGAANHQDFPGVGVAVPDALQTHRVRKLKEFGANAWRTAHNPPSTALLDATDREGLLVMDENHRNGRDEEMEALVLRDRNHPSVIIWSLCNERLCETSDTVGDAVRLKAVVRRLDPSMGRVLSANLNTLNGNNSVLDVQGFDYSAERYDEWHARAPHIPAISSETSSAVSDRGEYADDPAGGHVTGYDTQAPDWGSTAEVAWGAILARPFIAGGFTWTGWDYRGEPTPYAWPDVSSHFGILDSAGFWKDRTHWYHACWAQLGAEPVLHLLPHWNWEPSTCRGGCHLVGGRLFVDVWAFSTFPQLELVLPNGTSLGVQNSSRCSHFAWKGVPYVPGRLTARAFENGALVATSTVETTGPPAAIRLSFEGGVGEQGLSAGSQDVALVKAEVVDREGRTVPTASDVISFSVIGGAAGDAAVVGTANGDPAEHTKNTSPERPAFHGLALALVRPGPLPGKATIRASAAGLEAARLGLQVLRRQEKRGEELLVV